MKSNSTDSNSVDEPEHEDVVFVIDSREKKPYPFADDTTITKTLATGDYSIEGFENVFAVERKSLSDFLMSITWERQRFKQEIDRGDNLLGFVVVIESDLKQILNWDYERNIHPNAVIGTVENWSKYHKVEFLWCGDRDTAEQHTRKILLDWYESCQSMQ